MHSSPGSPRTTRHGGCRHRCEQRRLRALALGASTAARNELVRRFGEALRRHKSALGALITLECGKIASEGEGEVQEMIDICDFALGLAPALRPHHRFRTRRTCAARDLASVGPVGVISAFNFPMAVWSWNAAIALVCGDAIIWKPSRRPAARWPASTCWRPKSATWRRPRGLSAVLIGGREVGAQLVDDRRVPLISATGSCAMGRIVGPRVAQRFGRTILELGGNNAIIVAPSADLDLALRAIVFGAWARPASAAPAPAGSSSTARSTPGWWNASKRAYGQLVIGDPARGRQSRRAADRRPPSSRCSSRCRPRASRRHRQRRRAGAGGALPGAWYVQPAIVEGGAAMSNSFEEIFAPILYCFEYSDLPGAIAASQRGATGSPSAIFTNELREAERFVSALGSDCGIANVNVGTSGAEIGGAFGGERKPAAAANRAPTRGAATCAARPPPSTIRASCRLPGRAI